jgi:hypothetical protein
MISIFLPSCSPMVGFQEGPRVLKVKTLGPSLKPTHM